MGSEMNSQSCNIDDFVKTCLEDVSKVMKHANSLPLADYDYWAIEKCFTTAVGVQRAHMLNMIQYILTKHGFKNKLREEMDEEDILACITSVCDQLMERINSNLDEASGKKPSSSLYMVSKVATPKSDKTSELSLVTQKIIPKPQGAFKVKVDNSDLPFKPCITHKPNALRTLEDSLVLENGEYSHPYAFELDSLQVDPKLLTSTEPQKPQSLEQMPFSYIDKESQLRDLVSKLQSASEVAVDLEHHSFRSYQGFTCLMQLSTRHEDFIIDTLPLRHHMHLLNSVFTNPRILKVFHGSDCDIEWLQKDFGVYVVNLFDTGQAARLLHLPHLSLAYLLQTICDVTADKQFQRADWRIRDLPEVYLRYAREDTHHLLYIYDVLKERLLQRGLEQDASEPSILLHQAFINSCNLCKKRYQKPVVTERTHIEMCQRRVGRGGKALPPQGVEVLRRLCLWRDKLARIEDESVGYILPEEIMFQIAQNLPLTEASILSCCKTYIPPTLKRQLDDVKLIVNDVITSITLADLNNNNNNNKNDGGGEGDEGTHSSASNFFPTFTHNTFDPSEYDDSFLNTKVLATFNDSFFNVADKKLENSTVFTKLDRLFLSHLPQHLVPKNYKMADYKVAFKAAPLVESAMPLKVVEPEVIRTAEEIKFSNDLVSLRTKIKTDKKADKETDKETVKKTNDETDKKTDKETNMGKGPIKNKNKQAAANTPSKNNNNNNNNNNKHHTIATMKATKTAQDGTFQAKVYEKKELTGMVKEAQKGNKNQKRLIDPTQELANQPASSKKARRNFHKGNKSHSFVPRK